MASPMRSAPPRILIAFGTRPEAIKLAPLVKAIADDPDIEMEVCVTAQHRSMLDQALDVFAIRPRYDLDIMRPSQTLPDLSARILTGACEVIRDFRPNWVIVQGDTTTALAVGLAAFYERVQLAHVEAGLRTDDKNAPFPEEINRRLVGCLADLNFAPNDRAKANLLRENCPKDSIEVTGNTVVDALLWVVARFKSDPVLARELGQRFSFLNPGHRIVLVTGHRRESFGRPLENVCHALVDIVKQADDIEIVFPVHMNPNVRAPVQSILGSVAPQLSRRIHLIEPVDYAAFVYLMMRSALIITDSGGVQEEAPTLGRPVLVTRGITERPEAVAIGAAKLVGTDRKRIVREAMRVLTDARVAAAMSQAGNPYGDGRACERILRRLRADSSALAAKPPVIVRPLPKFARA